MSSRVDPTLLPELKRYGAVKMEACFNCGNCTAVCPLSSDAHPFPRRSLRLVQVGAREKLEQSLDPWLCYYCGDCSATCPRQAEPAEAMMAIRRFLTASYDRSGHAARLYLSERAAWVAVLRSAAIALAAVLVFHVLTGFINVVTDRVALNTFAPVMLVWSLVLLHGVTLLWRIGQNVRYMVGRALEPLGGLRAVPLEVYLQEFKTLVRHAVAQPRFQQCGEDRSRWLKHWLLASGYALMLTMVLGLLWWFQTDELYPLYHPQRWLGYYATAVLMFGSAEALYGRWRKREQLHRFSQHTDWLFPALLFVASSTGILVHIFRYAGWAWPTYLIYVIHLMVVVAMLDTEVGIGKWMHLLYRPLAAYLQAVKETAQARQAAGEVPVAAI